jgi:hypothetical protein
MPIGNLLDEPPYFIWKSGTLDVCDTLDELHDRYPAHELAQEDVVVCDSRGQALWISRAMDGVWVNAAQEHQPPSPDLLRSILWRYLEGCGTPREVIKSLSLNELVARACPEDPMEEYRHEAKFHGCVAGIIVVVLACVIVFLIDWWFGTNWLGG